MRKCTKLTRESERRVFLLRVSQIWDLLVQVRLEMVDLLRVGGVDKVPTDISFFFLHCIRSRTCMS
jgi:hypothetical protein